MKSHAWWTIPWTHNWWFDDLATLVGIMELLYDDDDLVWSLTCYGTHEHALGMMKNPMNTCTWWRRLWIIPCTHTWWFNGPCGHLCVDGVLKPLNDKIIEEAHLEDDDNLVEESHLEDDDALGGRIADMDPMVILLQMEWWHLAHGMPLKVLVDLCNPMKMWSTKSHEF